jgi:hypothetical protein
VQHLSRKTLKERPIIVGVGVRIILKYFLEQIQCGDEKRAVAGSIERDSEPLSYIKAQGFPDPIASTSQGLCPLEVGVCLVPRFEWMRTCRILTVGRYVEVFRYVRIVAKSTY